jgi:hypothetical protein
MNFTIWFEVAAAGLLLIAVVASLVAGPYQQGGLVSSAP